MMAVTVTTSGDRLVAERPRLLFEHRYTTSTPYRNYDVADDGRFLMIETIEQPRRPITQLRVIRNWFDELERLVPTQD